MNKENSTTNDFDNLIMNIAKCKAQIIEEFGKFYLACHLGHDVDPKSIANNLVLQTEFTNGKEYYMWNLIDRGKENQKDELLKEIFLKANAHNKKINDKYDGDSNWALDCINDDSDWETYYTYLAYQNILGIFEKHNYKAESDE